jgi:molybdate transport system ATP-binding protein
MTLELMARAEGPIPLDVEFRVEPGELLALVGHSGSGKSTLLRTIAGLWRPENARVAVNGQVWCDTGGGIDLPTHERRVGVVFQAYALFPHMTAVGNVIAALDHLPRAERRGEAMRLLDLVHLSGFENRRPAELSGGQQQRVAVARALARRPQALLLDEPFSAVDRATRDSLHREIRDLRRYLAMPVVLVTHDLDEARILADRMVVIERGHVVAQGGAASVLFDPRALAAMGMREAGAAIHARIARHEADGLTRLETSAGPIWLPRVEGREGAAVRIQIMAHEVMIARETPSGLSALNDLPARVVAVTPVDASGVLVQLEVGSDVILSRITRRSVERLGLAPGVACHAILKAMAVARDHVGEAEVDR